MKRELLDNGNIWQKSDGRWIGMVRYKDEYGVTKRKSFSSKKKKTLQRLLVLHKSSSGSKVATQAGKSEPSFGGRPAKDIGRQSRPLCSFRRTHAAFVEGFLGICGVCVKWYFNGGNYGRIQESYYQLYKGTIRKVG